MRSLIAFTVISAALSGTALAACSDTLTDCPSPRYNNLTLGGTLNAPTGVGTGTYGDATHVPVIAIGPDGRIRSATTAVITGSGGGGGSPTGTAGGDLGGTYPNPTVDGLQGKPVANTAPTNGQSLVFNGTSWAPSTVSGGSGPPTGAASGDLSGSYPGPAVAKIQGKPVATTAPTNGQVLQWNGTAYAPATVTGSGGSTPPGGSPNQLQVNLAGAFGGVGFGTAGQVLVSQGSSSPPSFADPVTSALAGNYADGWNVTMGTKADAGSPYSGTGAASEMQLLSGIFSAATKGSSNVGTASTSAITVQGNASGIAIPVTNPALGAVGDAANCATGNTQLACLRQIDVDVKAGTGTAGTPSSSVVSVQGNASGIPVPVSFATSVASTGPGTLDVKATAATAVVAITGPHAVKGGFIKNPDASTWSLCINQIGTAVAGATNGDTVCIGAGITYQVIPSNVAVSVIASDSGVHPFGGYFYQ